MIFLGNDIFLLTYPTLYTWCSGDLLLTSCGKIGNDKISYLYKIIWEYIKSHVPIGVVFSLNDHLYVLGFDASILENLNT